MHTHCKHMHASPRENDREHTPYLRRENEASIRLMHAHSLRYYTVHASPSKHEASIHLIHEHSPTRTCLVSQQCQRACTLFMHTQIRAHMHRFTTITVSVRALFMHTHTDTYIHASPRQIDSVSISLVHAHTYKHTCIGLHE